MKYIILFFILSFKIFAFNPADYLLIKQDTSSVKDDFFYFYFNFGTVDFSASDYSNIDQEGGSAIEYALVRIKHHRLLKLSYCTYHAFPTFNYSSNFHPSSSHINAMTGYLLTSRYFVLAAYGGIGYASGIKRGKILEVENGWLFGERIEYDKIHFQTFNVPVEIMFGITVLKSFGISLKYTGNFNTELISHGLLISLRFKAPHKYDE